jgi:sugar-specific transcriptional regulator TrmB
LSRDTVLRILTQIGFSQAEAEVYMFLAFKGPKKMEDIAISLQLPLFELQNILKRLQEKELVAAAPINFVALPFERVLDALAETRLQEAQEIVEKKKKIIAEWNSFVFRTIKN